MLISYTEVQYFFLHIWGRSFLQISAQILANLTENFRGFLSKSWTRHSQIVSSSMPRPVPLFSIKTQDSHIKHSLMYDSEEREQRHLLIRAFDVLYCAICHFISVSCEAYEQADFCIRIEFNNEYFVPRYYNGIYATY